MLKLALGFFAAKARAMQWLLIAIYISTAALLLIDDARSGWTWSFIIGGGLLLILFIGLVRFWLAFFTGLGNRHG